VNTAFGVLFLLRSTKKAIQRSKTYGDGVLLAGRGLPGEIEQFRVRDGQVVAKEIAIPTVELIDILSRPDDAAFASIAADVELLRQRVEAANDTERPEHLAQLRKLATSGVPDARLAAVRVLGRLKDVASGPTLIAALGDPDWQVAKAADEALRFLGRKGPAGALGEKRDEKARAAAIESWKAWFLAIRPDADLDL
jgi:HEAT repeat protein